MNLRIRIIVILLTIIPNCIFAQSYFPGVVGVHDLQYCKLFVNIENRGYAADEERYYPSLFTVRLPNSLRTWRIRKATSSVYAFLFDQNQRVYILEKVARKENAQKYSIDVGHNGQLLELPKDSVDSFFNDWIGYDQETLSILISNKDMRGDNTARRCFVTTKGNVLFVFYNVVDIDMESILDSFILIAPQRFELVHD